MCNAAGDTGADVLATNRVPFTEYFAKEVLNIRPIAAVVPCTEYRSPAASTPSTVRPPRVR